MLTRRDFLQTTLIALAVPAVATARAPASLGGHARLIAIGGCPEGDAFCGAGTAGATRVGPDVGEILQLLLKGEPEADATAWCGLTRDSDYMLIRQALLEHGMREVYVGDHMDTPSGWRHELHAGTQSLERLAPAIARAGANWADELAACCPRFVHAVGMPARRVLTTASYPRPAGAPTQLKSWGFRA